MSTKTDYINDQEFRDYIKSKGTEQSDLISDAITAASRAADAYCGRHFYVVENTTRYFCADGFYCVQFGVDLANTTGLTVLVDSDGNGTYDDTWTFDTDFILEPVNQISNGITGWPYTKLRAIGSKTFPTVTLPAQRPAVKVTGNWGWTDVPTPVKQAVKVIAAQYYKLAEAPLGVAGFGDFGVVRVRDNPQASSLLAPYRAGGSFGVA